MLKDIYIIKNDINDKVYIGQAKDSKYRFQTHCRPSAATKTNNIIDKAIQKYGREHFWYEILESQIEKYNEMEKYYIKLYNSEVPNGYNLTAGGEDPPHMVGVDHVESLLTHEQVEALTNDLRTTTITLTALAKKYGFESKTSVCDFNRGKTYYRENIEYPIRKENKIGKLSKIDVDQIIELLKTTKLTYTAIGQHYNVEARAISRINKGIYHHRDEENYPIRKK